MKGYFMKRMDSNTGEILLDQSQYLPNEFYTQLLTTVKRGMQKKLSNGTYEDPYFILYDYALNDDNSVSLILEQTHTVASDFSVTYYYQNLAIINIGEDGSFNWGKKIGKNNSKSGSPIYSHYLSARKKDAIFLLYNDSPQNLNHDKGPIKPAFGPTGTHFIQCTINPDGTFKRQMLMDDRHLGGIRIRPGLSRWLDDDTILVFGQAPGSLKSQRFAKLTFTEEE